MSNLSAPNSDSKATTFLTLPLEIRQCILLELYDQIISGDKRAVGYRQCLEWAKILQQVHLSIDEDMDYMRSLWERLFFARLGIVVENGKGPC
ncbi:hypothetical protein Vi05172_g6581 [Venturia inaequalis]|nr:hypothetical protein Vi05172_g6581 [Venturia inaequalis]